jgi:hypothetical protein
VVRLGNAQVSISKLLRAQQHVNRNADDDASKGCPPYSDYFHFTGKVNRGTTDHRPDLSIETKTASAEFVVVYPPILNDQLDIGIEASYGTGKTGTSPSVAMQQWQAVKACKRQRPIASEVTEWLEENVYIHLTTIDVPKGG